MTLLRRFYALSIVPIISIVLALLLGAVLIIISSVIQGKLNLMLPIVAYESLLQGATGFSFLDVKGDTITFAISVDPEKAARALTNTMQASAPLVLTGLAVGLGFKGGLFNIGGTGQVLVGGFTAALVGAAVAEQPVPIAVTIAVTAGALGGAAYGFIPGFLKAFTGAHEVVVTIMLNSLAAIAIVGLVNDVFKITGPTFARHRRRRQCRAADHLRPRRQSRDPDRPGGRPDRLRPDLPDDARVRDPDRRRQPQRRALRRHEPEAADHPHDEPVRALRRARRDDRDPRPGLLPGGVRDGDRLRRDHGRAPRQGPPGGDPARGAPARRDAGRRAGDADHREDPDRDHRRHPGPDPGVPRRRGRHPAGLPDPGRTGDAGRAQVGGRRATGRGRPDGRPAQHPDPGLDPRADPLRHQPPPVPRAADARSSPRRSPSARCAA